jgi:hypothetical protein
MDMVSSYDHVKITELYWLVKGYGGDGLQRHTADPEDTLKIKQFGVQHRMMGQRAHNVTLQGIAWKMAVPQCSGTR